MRALFLLAPVPSSLAAPDVPLAVAIGTCDGDTGRRSRVYFDRAARTPARQRAAFLVSIRRANHNYYNRTLARLSDDDRRPTCAAAGRPQAPAPANSSAGSPTRRPTSSRPPCAARAARPAAPGRRAPRRVYGLDVKVRRAR